jgi:hypothetical protein
MSLMFVNGLLEIRICFPLCCGFVVSLVYTMGRRRRGSTTNQEQEEQLPPPPPPPPPPLKKPGELKELPEDEQNAKLGDDERCDSEDDLLGTIQEPDARRVKTAAEIWLGPPPEDSEHSDVDVPSPDCVQGKAPLEGKYSDQGSEGNDKATGFRYQ